MAQFIGRAGRIALVAAAGLALAAPAFAQPPGGGGPPQGGRGSHGQQGPQGGQGAQGHGAQGHGGTSAGPALNIPQGNAQGGRYGRGTFHGPVGGQVQAAPRPGPGSFPVYRGYRGDDFQTGQAYGGDRRDFGQAFRALRRFTGPAYRRPDGWYAHRWAYGDILPALFWGQD